MSALPISKVRQNLFGLVQQVNDDHDPLTVVTKSGENAVLVAESDWNSLMETLYVLQTHGGVELLKSAQDARDGRTQTHALIDPDKEAEDVAAATNMAGALGEASTRIRTLFAQLRTTDDRSVRRDLLDELYQYKSALDSVPVSVWVDRPADGGLPAVLSDLRERAVPPGEPSA